MVEQWLREAIQLAEITRGTCAPNPAVGALVVKGDKVLSKGYHRGPGTPHAEIDALSKLSNEETKGATLICSLEPCCHHGRTPPCTDAIIEKQIKEVYFGFIDPNPQVSGAGVKQLKEHGVSSRFVSLPEVEAFYRSYQHWWSTKLPWIEYKIAISLDGKIAAADKTPVQLTSAKFNRWVHEQRKRHDAILTSATTILADNPRLNARLEETFDKPLYVLDPSSKTPRNAQIFSCHSKITFFKEESFDLKRVLEQIGRDGVHDLWIEAGSRLLMSLLADNLLQRLYIGVAPKVIGRDGYPAFLSSIEFGSRTTWSSFGEDGLCEVDFHV